MSNEPDQPHSISLPWPWLGVVLFAGATVAFGTVHGEPRAVVGGLAALLGLVATLHRPGHAALRPATLVAAGLASFALALDLAHLWPVGAETRAALQPGVASTIRDGLALAGTDLHPLALAPDRAIAASTWAAAMVLLAMGTAAKVRTWARQAVLAGGVVGVSCGVVLAAWAHRGMEAQQIWGWPGVPAAVKGPFFAPFVNPNHAAVICAAAVPLALAFVVRSRLEVRLAGVGAALLLTAGAWTTGSRGALIEWAVAVGAMALLQGNRQLRNAAAATTAAGGAAIAFIGPAQIWTHVETWVPGNAGQSPSGERLGLWADAWALVEGAPWAGVGAGGFEEGHHLVKTLPHFTTPSHAHQELLQALAEHGIPGGTLWIAASLVPVVVATTRIRRLEPGRRRTLGAAWLGLLAALGTACLFGFPLRVGALSVLACLALGSALAFGGRDVPALGPGGHKAMRCLAVALAALAWLGTATGLHAWNGPDGSWADSGRHLADGNEALSSGNLSAAKTAARKVLVHRPLSHKALDLLVRAQFAGGQVAEARNTLDVAVRAWPTLPWPWMNLGRLERAVGDHDRARTAWRHGLSLNLPDNDYAQPFVEEALLQGEDPLIEARHVVPDRWDRLRDAARILADHGHDTVAETLFLRAARTEPKAGLAYARFLLDRQRPAEAWTRVQQVKEVHCGTERTRGLALLRLERFQEADSHYKAALNHCGADDRASRIGLARSRLGLGDRSAISLLEKLVEEDPEAHALRRHVLKALAARARHEEMIPHLEALVLHGVAAPLESDNLRRLYVGLPPR